MFSEYASRFLQQSNARLSRSPENQRQQSRNPLDRRRHQSRSGMTPNPYQPAASQSRFPFAARMSRQEQAPLFYSAADDFQQDDDRDAHERELADSYALQRSRAQFGPSHLTDSSEYDEEDPEMVEKDGGQNHDREEDRRRAAQLARQPRTGEDEGAALFDVTESSSKGKGGMVDVNLASTIAEEEPPASLAHLAPESSDDAADIFQPFRPTKKDTRSSAFLPLETDEAEQQRLPHPPSPDRESVPPTVILPSLEPPKHDTFWANLFQISLFAMVGAFVLIWFNTSAPKTPLGDTVFSALRGSTPMLLWDTFIAVIVALVWLALLRSYMRPFVYVILVAVPVVLVSFSLYPLIASFRGSHDGSAIQDRAMRWLSPIPAIIAAVWMYNVILSRHSFSRAVEVLEFATRLLAASPYLVVLGFATLTVTVAFTWAWMLMFERIFLSGHFSGANNSARKWLVETNSWWLGAFFVLEYLWTLGVIAGIQRATAAATVSQWYFHRFAVPQPSSQQVVRASFVHAVGALFGTICVSTFVSLMIRLPLIILPGRISAVVNMCFHYVVPTSLVVLTNPLTLTYAAVHSQPLGIAARGLTQLQFLGSGGGNARGTATTTLFALPQSARRDALVPYRLAKHLLHATRFVMSFALGMAGWVRTARDLQLQNPSSSAGIRGSLYAYVVGLIAGTIGFAVLGAVENVVGAAVDAAVVCWASETGGGRGEARFCREAGRLFGDDGEVGDSVRV